MSQKVRWVMATVIRKATTVAPKVATVQKTVSRAVAKVAPKAPAVVAGFSILKGIEIPAKRAFGKRGVFNDLFAQLEAGDCVEIPVEADKKIVSKMNAIYNAARRNNSSVTMRIHSAGDADGRGGVLRLWYNGQFQEA
jgi:hypothetical protein